MKHKHKGKKISTAKHLKKKAAGKARKVKSHAKHVAHKLAMKA